MIYGSATCAMLPSFCQLPHLSNIDYRRSWFPLVVTGDPIDAIYTIPSGIRAAHSSYTLRSSFPSSSAWADLLPLPRPCRPFHLVSPLSMSSTAPPTPGSIVIPLPPGMTPAEFEHLQSALGKCLVAHSSVVLLIRSESLSYNCHYYCCGSQHRDLGLVSVLYPYNILSWLKYIHQLELAS